jgi:hypothetical protein
MKATLVLSALVLLALVVMIGEPTALASGFTVATQATRAPEPAWMLLSGATLLAVASAVKRLVP